MRSLGPHHVLGNELVAGEGAESAVGTGDHAPLVAHHLGIEADAVSDHFGVLQVVGGHVDHARDQDHGLGRRVRLDRLPLVLVARVGAGDAESADLGLVNQGSNGARSQSSIWGPSQLPKQTWSLTFLRRDVARATLSTRMWSATRSRSRRTAGPGT